MSNYARKPLKALSRRYEIDYSVETHNLSRFLAFLSPDVYVSRGAKAEGIFKMDNTAGTDFQCGVGYGELW